MIIFILSFLLILAFAISPSDGNQEKYEERMDERKRRERELIWRERDKRAREQKIDKETEV